jgi:hypothetical protein
MWNASAKYSLRPCIVGVTIFLCSRIQGGSDSVALAHAAVLLALGVSPRRGNQHARANRVMLVHGGGISMRSNRVLSRTACDGEAVGCSYF